MTEKPNLDALPAETAPATRAARFARFWSRPDILVFAIYFALLIIPGLFLMFGWSTSMATFAEAPPYLKIWILGAILCFYVGPFLAVVFSFLFTLCRSEIRPRLLGAVVLVATLFAAALPFRSVCNEISHLRKLRLYERFDRAVFAADGAEAQKIAEKLDDYLRFRSSALYDGAARESSGDYSGALEVYKVLNDKAVSLQARTLYRLDRRADAFAAYCRFAEKAEPSNEALRPVALAAAKRRVLLYGDANERSPLDPFADYAEFLRFVKTEFAKTDDPAKYETAVQFWRDAEKIAPLAAIERPKLREDDALLLTDGDYLIYAEQNAERRLQDVAPNPETEKTL